MRASMKRIIKYAALAGAAYYVYTNFLSGSSASTAGLGYSYGGYGGNPGQDGPGYPIGPYGGGIIPWHPIQPPRRHRHRPWLDAPGYDPYYVEPANSLAARNAELDAMEAGN